MAKFFTSFPLVYQNGMVCRDIIRSVHLTQDALRSAQLYYDFDVTEGQRPDTISYDYYKTPYYDWLIYFANNIQDPYYGWYLPSRQFDTYITEKYGSISKAMETIDHYKVNWESDGRTITSQVYQSLSAGQRKYWRPKDAYSDSLYVRKELDWTSNTNLVSKVGVASTTGFARGDYINQYDGVELVASGTIAMVGADHLKVRSITGAFVVGGTVACPDTEVTSTVTSYDIVTRCIPEEELTYWVGVEAYDSELEANDNLKSIRLVDKMYARFVQEDLEQKLGAEQ